MKKVIVYSLNKKNEVSVQIDYNAENLETAVKESKNGEYTITEVEESEGLL